METQMISGHEARIVEPIFRMVKVISDKDPVKAQGLAASVIQFLNDYYKDQVIRPNDVQQVIKTVLLAQSDSEYYLMHLFNELQVKVAGWLTSLGVDLPVKIGELADLANEFADDLKEVYVDQLTSQQVLTMVAERVKQLDTQLYERFLLNQEFFGKELDAILIKQNP